MFAVHIYHAIKAPQVQSAFIPVHSVYPHCQHHSHRWRPNRWERPISSSGEHLQVVACIYRRPDMINFEQGRRPDQTIEYTKFPVDCLSTALNISYPSGLSESTVKRNHHLEARVADLELELLVWKQAHSVALEASEREVKAHNVQIATLNRQISNMDIFRGVRLISRRVSDAKILPCRTRTL